MKEDKPLSTPPAQNPPEPFKERRKNPHGRGPYQGWDRNRETKRRIQNQNKPWGHP
jgi:hypothetical protein